MTDVEHAKKYAEESISLAISMYNPKAEDIARMACLYGLTYKNEQIAKLEKENAELKEINTHTLSQLNLDNGELITELTKAKEIIKEFIEWANWQGNSKCPSFKSIQDKAEQFLNEVSHE